MPNPESTTPPAPTSPRRRRGCLAKLLALSISTVIALLLAEAILRVFGSELLPNPIGPRYLYQRDPVLGIDHRPGFEGRFSVFDEFDVAIEISSQGLRDREYGPKAKGTKRILSLSDSFGFGYGVEAEEAYAKCLERRLNGDASPRKFEVINAAASARGICHMIEILDRLGPKMQPDVVLASFFYVNDLIDIQGFPEHTERGGIVMTRGIGTVVDNDAWLNFGVYWSELALWAWRAKFNLEQHARKQAFRLGEVSPDGRTWSTEMLLANPDPKKPNEVALIKGRDELWKQFETHLAALRAKTEKLGAELVLFTIPQATQTRDAVWQRDLDDKIVVEGKFDRFLIGKKLTAICERTGVRLFDMVPGFRATKPENTRFFPINRHFNVAGHAFAAKLLDEYLRREKLL